MVRSTKGGDGGGEFDSVRALGISSSDRCVGVCESSSEGGWSNVIARFAPFPASGGNSPASARVEIRVR